MMMKIRIIPALFSLLAFSVLASDISTRETELGQVYTDSKGMTLYIFDKDKADQSTCYEDCAKAWPPLLVKDEATQFNGLGKITRKDGKQQWTLNHHPIYLWNKDQRPGDITGAGVKNIWSLARVDQAPVKVYNTDSGKILTNQNHMSLYTFSKDSKGVSACYEECAKIWPPLVAQKEAVVSGEFSVIARKDGIYQWAYQGNPLYTWVKDTQPGDITGDMVKNVWHLVRL
ncbi:hypothetical protein CJJ13_24975 [Serratia fonticola]|nr:hypothetical protein CJJ13_24975 [Serratia fonticola]